MAITHQDLILAARDLIEEPAESEIRNTGTLIRFGGEADRFLLETLPREWLGTYAATKTITLTTTTDTYAFTSSDSFSGLIDVLDVGYTTYSGSARAAVWCGMEFRPAARSGVGIHVSRETPVYFVEGQNLTILPLAADANASAIAYYRKTTSVTWSATLTDTWAFHDFAFEAGQNTLVFLAKHKLAKATASAWREIRNMEVVRLWHLVGRPPPPKIMAMLGMKTGP